MADALLERISTLVTGHPEKSEERLENARSLVLEWEEELSIMSVNNSSNNRMALRCALKELERVLPKVQ